MFISFIIPAFNEERLLPRVLDSIKHCAVEPVEYEIIVVDHGSTDNTVRLAAEAGVTLLQKRGGTVAALRNYGAKHARGELFVFLDADVLLTKSWRENFAETLDRIKDAPLLLTGSWVGVSENPGWLERLWFAPLVNEEVTHINSGHMIVSRALFEKIGGFKEELETGEDYDFSLRAEAAGGTMVSNPRLEVSHEGYPKSLGQFIRREIWHGKGDFYSLSMFLRSKVAILAVVFLSLHVAALITCVTTDSRLLCLIPLLLICAICLISAVRKYSESGASIITANALIYYVYFWARALSLFAVIFRSGGQRRHRESKAEK